MAEGVIFRHKFQQSDFYSSIAGRIKAVVCASETHSK